jgi:hypothetical protein
MPKVEKCQSTKFQSAELYNGEYCRSVEMSKRRITKWRIFAKIVEMSKRRILKQRIIPKAQNSLTAQNFKVQNSLKGYILQL